jgi:hypothetical protein
VTRKSRRRARQAALDKPFDRTLKEPPYNTETAPMEIVDPYSTPLRPERIMATRTLRDDPLARLHAREQVGEADYLAGRKWQALYELAEMGQPAAVNVMREGVDAMRAIPEGTSDSRMRAARELRRLDQALGLEGCALVRDVLAHRRFIDEVARRRGLEGRGKRDYLGRRFRECLATLAVELGYREL